MELRHLQTFQAIVQEGSFLQAAQKLQYAQSTMRLSRLLVEFCQEYPKVRLTLETGVTQVISQRVAEGELDIAICSPPAARLGLAFEQLFCDPMALLIPVDHPLSQKAVIQVADLQGERLLLTERHCPYREVFEKAILTNGITPCTGLEIISLEALRRMVVGGLGVGVMPVDSVTPAPQGTVVQMIDRLSLELPVGIAQFPEGSIPGLALDRLIQRLRNELSNPSLLLYS